MAYPLQASNNHNPPFEMKTEITLMASFAVAGGVAAVFIHGRQARRQMDEEDITRQGG